MPRTPEREKQAELLAAWAELHRSAERILQDVQTAIVNINGWQNSVADFRARVAEFPPELAPVITAFFDGTIMRDIMTEMQQAKAALITYRDANQGQ